MQHCGQHRPKSGSVPITIQVPLASRRMATARQELCSVPAREVRSNVSVVPGVVRVRRHEVAVRVELAGDALVVVAHHARTPGPHAELQGRAEVQWRGRLAIEGAPRVPPPISRGPVHKVETQRGVKIVEYVINGHSRLRSVVLSSFLVGVLNHGLTFLSLVPMYSRDPKRKPFWRITHTSISPLFGKCAPGPVRTSNCSNLKAGWLGTL